MAVSDRHFWAPAPPAVPDADIASAPTEVRVRLFGALAPAGLPQPVVLRLAPPATVASVLASLGRVLGPERVTDLADTHGRKRRTCRLFVDGRAVDEVETALVPGARRTDIEIIVLAGIEGG